MAAHKNLPPHTPSQNLKNFLVAHLPNEKLLLTVQSNLNLLGHYSNSWLCVTSETLITLEESADGSIHIQRQLPLSGITSITKATLNGGGMLVCKTEEGSILDLVRFADSQAFLFASIGDRIKHYGIGQSKNIRALEESLSDVRNEELSHFCHNCYRPYDANTKVCNFCVNRTLMLRRVLQFAHPYRFHYIFLILLMAVSSIIQLLPSIITGKIIDNVIDKKNESLLIPLLIALFGSMLAGALIHIIHARLGIYVGSKITASIRQKLFNHLQSLSLKFFDKQASGALINRVSSDAQSMQGFLVEGIQYTIYNVLLIIGIAVTLFIMNPLIGMVILLPAPFVIYISKKSWTKIHFFHRKYWDASSIMHAYLADSLSGVKEIKTTGQEDRVRQTFSEKNNAMVNRSITAESAWQTLVPFLNLLIQTPLLCVWYFGANDVIKSSTAGGDFTTGKLVTMIGLMALMFGPLQLLTRLNDWVARALASAERIFEILDTKPKIMDAQTPSEKTILKGDVEFQKVVFGYEKHKPVIHHLSIQAKPGEMIGFVGKSGVGKSTLMKLLLRLYDVDEGAISIDGVNIKNIRRDVLNNHISVVMQDTFLFHGSIAENIAFAKPNATRQEIITAAMLANAHEFIMKLPSGYDSFVGERGTNMSGGERQRIAIARALISNPKILILDEATANVDTETEQKIQQALQRLIRGRTTFAIAHRLSTLRNADRLYVIDNGEVKESGTHEELMKLENGIYQHLVTIQTDWARNVFANNP